MAQLMEAWLVDAIEKDLRRVVDGTLKAGTAHGSNEYWYKTGSGIQAVLQDSTPQWVQVVNVQTSNNKVISATLSDTHRSVVVRFSQDSLKQERGKASSSWGPGAVGSHLVLTHYEICVSDSRRLDQRVTLLVRGFKYKGAKSRDLLKPKPLATDPRVQAILRDLSEYAKSGKQEAEDGDGDPSDAESGPASQPAGPPVLHSQQTFATQAPRRRSDVEILRGVNLSGPKEARKQDGGVERRSAYSTGTRLDHDDPARLLSLLEKPYTKTTGDHREMDDKSASVDPPESVNGTEPSTPGRHQAIPNIAEHDGDFSFTGSLPTNLDVPQDQRDVLERSQSWQYQADGKKCSGLNLPNSVLDNLRARADGKRSASRLSKAHSSDTNANSPTPASIEPQEVDEPSEDSSSNDEQPLSSSGWPDSDYETEKASKDQLPPDSSMEKPLQSSPRNQSQPLTKTKNFKSPKDNAADVSASFPSPPRPASQSSASGTSRLPTTDKTLDARSSPPASQEAMSSMDDAGLPSKRMEQTPLSNTYCRSLEAEECNLTRNIQEASQIQSVSTLSPRDIGRLSDRKYGLFTRRQNGTLRGSPSPRLPGSSPASVVPATYNAARHDNRASTFATPGSAQSNKDAYRPQDITRGGHGGLSGRPSSDAGFEASASSPRPHKKARLNEQSPRNGADYVRDLAKQHKRDFLAARRARKQANDELQLDTDRGAPRESPTNSHDDVERQTTNSALNIEAAPGTKPNPARTMATAIAAEEHTSQSFRPNDSSPAKPAKSRQAATEDLYTRFRSAYPSYIGDRKRMLARCRMIDRLNTNKQLHRSLWDDFVIRHETDYLPYSRRCDEEGDVARPYPDYYDDQFDEPLYTKKILTPDSITALLTSDPTSRAFVGSDAFQSNAATTPATTDPAHSQRYSSAAVDAQLPRNPMLPAKPPTPTAFTSAGSEASDSARSRRYTPSELTRVHNTYSPSYSNTSPTRASSYSHYPSGPSTSTRLPTGPRLPNNDLIRRPLPPPANARLSSDSRVESYHSPHQPSPSAPPLRHPRTTGASHGSASEAPSQPSSLIVASSYNRPTPAASSIAPQVRSLQPRPPTSTAASASRPPNASRSNTQKPPQPSTQGSVAHARQSEITTTDDDESIMPTATGRLEGTSARNLITLAAEQAGGDEDRGETARDEPWWTAETPFDAFARSLRSLRVFGGELGRADGASIDVLSWEL